MNNENEQQMDVATGAEKDAPRAGWLLKGSAILVLLLNLALGALASAAQMSAAGQPANLPMLVGMAVGRSVFAPLIVLLLFQIFARFRNERSRWRIFLVTSLLLLVSTLGTFAPAAQGG